MPRVEGLNELKTALQRKLKDAKSFNSSVQVGYTQRYALAVHEDLDAHHNVGQAKYLEAPARRMQKELAQTIKTVYRKTKDMEKALIEAGLRLQRESQLLVPVDTSALKSSAYTALDREANVESQKAFQKSEQIREAAGR